MSARSHVFIALCLLGGCRSDPGISRTDLAAPKPTVLFPGPQADGSVLLPNQWKLNPLGRQIPVGDFPVNIAVHPGGRFAAVLHCGYSPHEIAVIDLAQSRLISRIFTNQQQFDLPALKGRLLSSSYVPEAGQPRHIEMMQALEHLFESHQQEGRVVFQYDCRVYYCRLSL